MEEYYYTYDKPDTLSVICEAFEDIKEEIKLTLEAEDIPESLKVFIEADEKTEDVLMCDRFYSPLISIGLLEGYGSHYLQYAANTEIIPWVNPAVIAKLIRCIYNHTHKGLTMKNIEGMVEAHPYKNMQYSNALKLYELGNTKYQPYFIKQFKEEAE